MRLEGGAWGPWNSDCSDCTEVGSMGSLALGSVVKWSLHGMVEFGILGDDPVYPLCILARKIHSANAHDI